jgi:hypothetical protein
VYISHADTVLALSFNEGLLLGRRFRVHVVDCSGELATAELGPNSIAFLELSGILHEIVLRIEH